MGFRFGRRSTGLGGIGLGAVAFKLASVWLESRKGVPSKAKDTADLMAAGAAFQLALNNAAQGIVADLRAAVERTSSAKTILEVDDGGVACFAFERADSPYAECDFWEQAVETLKPLCLDR